MCVSVWALSYLIDLSDTKNNDFTQFISTLKFILEHIYTLPQIAHNFKRKSTQGLSRIMVLLWVVTSTGKYLITNGLMNE